MGHLRKICSILSDYGTLKNCRIMGLIGFWDRTGDFNINLLKHSTHPTTGAYLDLLLENGFLPLITLPTRIQNSSSSLWDHIATNISDTRYDANVIITDISDDFPLFYIWQK